MLPINNTGIKFATGTAGAVDTGTAGVNDTGGKIPPVSMTPAENLPLVSMTNNGNNLKLITH